MGCHFLLQGCFLTQESKPCLLHWQEFFFFFKQMSHQGSPTTVFLLCLCSIWYCLSTPSFKSFSLELHELAFSWVSSFAGYLACVILLKVCVLKKEKKSWCSSGIPIGPWLVPYTGVSWVISSTPMVSMMSRLIKSKSTCLTTYLLFEHHTVIIAYYISSPNIPFLSEIQHSKAKPIR